MDMDWDEDDFVHRIFDILFPPMEVIERAEAIMARRRRQLAIAQEINVRRGRQPGEEAQAEIAQWDRQPVEGGEQIVRRREQPAEGGEQIVRRRRQPAEGGMQEVIALRGRHPADDGPQEHVALRGAEGGAQEYAAPRGAEGGAQEYAAPRGAIGGAQEYAAPRGAEGGAQANVIQLGGQPAEVGAGENRDIMEDEIINFNEFFRRMDLEAFDMCRKWFMLLLGAVDPSLSNEQRQTIEGFRHTLFHRICVNNTVNRRIFVLLNSALVRFRNTVPDHVVTVLAARSLHIIRIDNDRVHDRLSNNSRAAQGFLGRIDAIFNIIFLIILKLFFIIISFFPLTAQKFFLPPPDRRFQNGHRSPR